MTASPAGDHATDKHVQCSTVTGDQRLHHRFRPVMARQAARCRHGLASAGRRPGASWVACRNRAQFRLAVSRLRRSARRKTLSAPKDCMTIRCSALSAQETGSPSSAALLHGHTGLSLVCGPFSRSRYGPGGDHSIAPPDRLALAYLTLMEPCMRAECPGKLQKNANGPLPWILLAGKLTDVVSPPPITLVCAITRGSAALT